jgi:hypothetical protein
MKTIKTANGIKKINDDDVSMVSIQLRSILQEHRATLISKLITGGLATYVDYKFSAKVSQKQMQQLKDSLNELRNAPLDISAYRNVFLTVHDNDFTVLDNVAFYTEIDQVIQNSLLAPKLYDPTLRRQFMQ